MSVHTTSTLLSLTLAVSYVFADSNITLLSLPVNLTSWQLSLHQALNHSFSHDLEGVRQTLRGYLQFMKNGSINCAAEGEECIPDVPSCCSAGPNEDLDLQCLSENGSYFCGKQNNSEELAQQRLDALQYGDSMGELASHPWADSWEFQSRSAMEIEEEKAAEEAKWKPISTENVWMKAYSSVKHAGKKVWGDLRKMKKLREIKELLMEKYKKRMSKAKAVTEPPGAAEEETEPQRPLMYPDEVVDNVEGKDQRENSEESVIKFSSEVPKREKKINFRIDDIIKDAAKLMGDKLKKKERKKHERRGKPPLISSMDSAEQPFRLDEIEETEDKLKKEISELKKLEKQQKKQKESPEPYGPDIEELIRKQVTAILEEERKLKKIQELRRLEAGGMR